MRSIAFCSIPLGLACVFAGQVVAAKAAPQAAAPSPVLQGLTPEQQLRFADANKAFSAAHWAEALEQFRALHNAVPANATITKFTAEADINTGQPAAAIDLLKPVLAADPNDVQALGISAHAFAQAHQAVQRDATLAQLQHLHDAGTTDLHQIVLERDTLPDGRAVLFFYFFEPLGRFHIAMLARLYDAAGTQLQRLTLESGDFDQPGFAREHPAEAAKGERAYSLDGYVDHPSTLGAGTQTHTTFAFFVGKPTYNTFHDSVLAAVQGKLPPLSSTSGIQLPPTKP